MAALTATTELFSYQSHSSENVDGDVLILLVPREERNRAAEYCSKTAKEAVQRLVEKELFQGEAGESIWFPSTDQDACPFVMLVGVGEGVTLQEWRVAASKAAREAKKLKANSVCMVPIWSGNSQKRAPSSLTAESVYIKDSSMLAYTVVEGFYLGQYELQQHLKASDPLQLRLYLAGKLEAQHLDAVRKAEIYASATNYARDLTNMPGNRLVPEQLADEAMRLAKQYEFACEVLTEEEIGLLGMGGLLAVGQGSIHPPRMITIRYTGNPASDETIALVGKGITFDTGGISLKKAAGMEEMVSDMGGAAAVLGVFDALGKLKPSINVLGVIPSAENMPSGAAYRPGDIITTLSGRTIEVLNTDAEGRIVLADAVTYAKQQGASKLIEISTLTGAVLVALGDTATAAVTNDDAFLNELLAASKGTGELIWQLPAFSEYKDMIKSDVADVKNSSGRHAATITAGLFIGLFAENTPWIHLDIGGTAWLSKAKVVDPKGGTGVMVRTLTEWLTTH